MKKVKKLYINTIGCQMNVYDSKQMAGRLEPLGYVHSPDMKDADMIIVNTCAIRAKAVQKVYSFLGRLKTLKARKPDLIIGVGGCVAQQEGHAIINRNPWVDLVFGTHAISKLADMVSKVQSQPGRVVELEISGSICESVTVLPDQISVFVTIMQGCDNYCSYCVVPFVRGAEISRAPASIINELTALVKAGMREVTLLGQNVNSYGKKENYYSFAQLLTQISRIDGLERIRFTTSHPKDLSTELIQIMGAEKKVCPHIHLPVQSGSNRILKKMNRKYTCEDYLKQTLALRQAIPEIAITSDFIVGFPGETATDFNDTLELIRAVEFDSLFAFKYSDRPKAPATKFKSKVSEQEKKERLQILLDLQEKYTLKKNKLLLGRQEPVLVDGYSKKQITSGSNSETIQWSGRTNTNKIVNFNLDTHNRTIIAGSLVLVKIEQAYSHSLWGIT